MHSAVSACRLGSMATVNIDFIDQDIRLAGPDLV